MEFPLPPKKLSARLEPGGASVQRGSLPKKLQARLEPLPYSKVAALSTHSQFLRIANDKGKRLKGAFPRCREGVALAI